MDLTTVTKDLSSDIRISIFRKRSTSIIDRIEFFLFDLETKIFIDRCFITFENLTPYFDSFKNFFDRSIQERILMVLIKFLKETKKTHKSLICSLLFFLYE